MKQNNNNFKYGKIVHLLLYGRWELGAELGCYIAKRVPREIIIGVISVVLIGMFSFLCYKIYGDIKEYNHYKKIMASANKIWEAEEKYFARKGVYTADLTMLDFEIPPDAETQYEPSRYVVDLGQEVLTPEKFIYTLSNGDSFFVNIIKNLSFGDKKENSYSLLEISVYPKFRSLPSSYTINKYFGSDNLPYDKPVRLCEVMIQHASTWRQNLDIQYGGSFCRKFGAVPTDIDLTWVFPED